MMKKICFQVLATVLLLGFLAACSFVQERESNARLATMYATIKVVDGDAAKADRVEEIATEIREYASGEKFLTVDLLVDQVRKQVNWDRLDAADKLLVSALLDELKLQLIERLGADVLPEDLRLAADTVAGWVITAARMQ